MSPRSITKIAKYAKYAKSITVKAPENGVTSVKLTAVYKGNLCDDEKVNVTLTQNGQSYTFPEMTEYIASQHWGTWTAIRPIHLLKGTITNGKGEGKSFEVNPKDYCNQVIPNLEFSLHHELQPVKMIN